MNEHLELFKTARESITHEDGLVNQRVTWFLVFQGLLINGYLDKEKNLIPFDLSIVICAIGIISSLVAFFAIQAALRRITEVEYWWEKQGKISEFPPIVGKGHENLLGLKITAASMFIIILGMWIYLIARLYLRC